MWTSLARDHGTAKPHAAAATPAPTSPPPSPPSLCPQAKALYAALAQWNTLEVSVRVDRTIVTRLLSRSGRILAGISSNMGITLLVEREKGVLRGRARTEDDAKEANRVLKLKVRRAWKPTIRKISYRFVLRLNSFWDFLGGGLPP